MACPFWGDGSLWGDGDLWCRGFEVFHAVSEVDSGVFHRLSPRITVTTATEVLIARISGNVQHNNDLPYTYYSGVDRHDFVRVSPRLEVTTDASFVIDRVQAEVQVKKHLPLD